MELSKEAMSSLTVPKGGKFSCGLSDFEIVDEVNEGEQQSDGESGEVIRPSYYRCPLCGSVYGRPFGERKYRPIRRCPKCWKVVTMEIAPNVVTEDGGPGSGNHGHEGRPGEIGGSAPSASSLNDSLASALKKSGSEFAKKAKEIVHSVPAGTKFEQFGVVFTKIDDENWESSEDGVMSSDRVFDMSFPEYISESMLPKFQEIESEDIATAKIASGELDPKETSASGKGVAIAKYQDYGYQEVNDALRKGKKLEGEAAEIDKGLQEGFRDAEPTRYEQRVYRDSGLAVTSKAFEDTGVGRYLAENLKGRNLLEAWGDPEIRQTIVSGLIGYEYKEAGYSSTTKSREFLTEFSAGHGSAYKISEYGAKESMTINIPAGSKVLDLGESGMIVGSGENETIINKGAKYRIKDVYLDNEIGGLGLVCDYLPEG